MRRRIAGQAILISTVFVFIGIGQIVLEALGINLASSMPGSRVRGSIVRPTAHIQCAERRRRRPTERLVTFARFSFSSDIRSSKAPSGISGSRWMTLSASQSRLNSDGTSRPCHLAGPQPTWATMPGVAPYLPFTIRVGPVPETLRMNNSYRCGPQSAPQPEIKPFGATAGENPPRMAIDKDGPGYPTKGWHRRRPVARANVSQCPAGRKCWGGP